MLENDLYRLKEEATLEALEASSLGLEHVKPDTLLSTKSVIAPVILDNIGKPILKDSGAENEKDSPTVGLVEITRKVEASSKSIGLLWKEFSEIELDIPSWLAYCSTERYSD